LPNKNYEEIMIFKYFRDIRWEAAFLPSMWLDSSPAFRRLMAIQADITMPEDRELWHSIQESSANKLMKVCTYTCSSMKQCLQEWEDKRSTNIEKMTPPIMSPVSYGGFSRITQLADRYELEKKLLSLQP